METGIHEEFVKAIRKTIIDKDMAVLKLDKDKVVSVVSDILCLSREAVYRRLRGDVRFSLEEASLIALKLDVSIDSLVGLKNKEKSLIRLNFLEQEKDFRVKYFEKVNEQVALFESVTKKFDDSVLTSAFNRLPYTLFLHYENLSKFRLFKWGYQMGALQNERFKDLILSEELFAAQKKLVQKSRNINRTCFILSPTVFDSLIKEINYFYYLNLIDKDDMSVIKKELNGLLEEMENLAITGSFNSKSSVYFYLSDLDLAFSNLLFKYGQYYYTYVNIYDLGGIESQNQRLCEYQEMWIEGQRRYSKLITESNEIERHRFFERQRRLVNEN